MTDKVARKEFGKLLMKAVSCGKLEDAKDLIKQKPIITREQLNIAFIKSCLDDDMDLFNILIKYNPDVNVKDSMKRKPITMAYSNNNHEMVKILIEKGADANMKNFDKKTLLMLACNIKNYDMVEALLTSDIDIEEKDKYGNDALYYSQEDLKIHGLLVDHMYKYLDKFINNELNENSDIDKKNDKEILDQFDDGQILLEDVETQTNNSLNVR